MSLQDMLKTVERAMMIELITEARKDPEKCRELFHDTLKELDKALKDPELDFGFVDRLANLMMNLLPETEGKETRDACNRVMGEAILAKLSAFKGKPPEFFTHEVKPCDCPVCRSKGPDSRQVHLAN